VSKLRKHATGSNLVDTGRDAVRNYPLWMVDSEADSSGRWGGHVEGLRRRRGDTAGAKLGATLIDRFTVNTGTIPHRSHRSESIRVGGIDASFVEGAGWGGGSVVVRAHERCVHGEGGQQVSGESTGMPGGRR
jgi:hypothetical protein